MYSLRDLLQKIAAGGGIEMQDYSVETELKNPFRQKVGCFARVLDKQVPDKRRKYTFLST